MKDMFPLLLLLAGWVIEWCVVSTIQNARTQVFQGPGTWFGAVRDSRGSGIGGSRKFLTPGLRGSLGADVGREQPLPPREELFGY